MRLEHWVETFAGDERDEAHDEFWGPHVEYIDSLPEELEALSNAAEETWFAFDRGAETGETAVDRFMADADLSDGERTFLSACRRSSVRLYTVVGVVPGVSLTLRDAIEGGEITVSERMGSRSIGLFEHVAARVVPRGPSGGPEIESGILHIPALYRLLAGPGTFAAGSARVLFSLSLASADSRISGVISVILPVDENEGGVSDRLEEWTRNRRVV